MTVGRFKYPYPSLYRPKMPKPQAQSTTRIAKAGYWTTLLAMGWICPPAASLSLELCVPGVLGDHVTLELSPLDATVVPFWRRSPGRSLEATPGTQSSQARKLQARLRLASSTRLAQRVCSGPTTGNERSEFALIMQRYIDSRVGKHHTSNAPNCK